ncbi:hypothetical protein [Burkholderia sp. Ac-20365]|uniref:hypothetical protein n=1 Tax=Burkholderia sp. Ac-20365 TaxID=2703897 RepID=UPI00197BA70D|nr:hypothetical protein [Burkholderia sp. Ac-20365]MBN3760748.1 hypothetical protein [Burkholderia sp. Ac-20365]
MSLKFREPASRIIALAVLSWPLHLAAANCVAQILEQKTVENGNFRQIVFSIKVPACRSNGSIDYLIETRRENADDTDSQIRTARWNAEDRGQFSFSDNAGGIPLQLAVVSVVANGAKCTCID